MKREPPLPLQEWTLVDQVRHERLSPAGIAALRRVLDLQERRLLTGELHIPVRLHQQPPHAEPQ